SLAISIVGVHLFEDPNELFVRVGQKMRSRGISVPALRTPSPNQTAELLFEAGEYTESAALFESSGFRGHARARKIRRQLEELATPIQGSALLNRELELSNAKILFYLTNSKPFTQSGYTERTHHLLMSL